MSSSRELSPSTSAATTEVAAPTHTPGPWQLYRHSALTVSGPDGHRTVATCGGYTNNTRGAATDAENHANARLISAAPDLLEALQKLDVLLDLDPADTQAFAQDLGIGDPEPLREALSLVRAAIAKATSEQQPRAPEVSHPIRDEQS